MNTLRAVLWAIQPDADCTVPHTLGLVEKVLVFGVVYI